MVIPPPSIPPSIRGRLEDLYAVATARSDLQLLVLFGSRARGDAAAGSDWDFGYLGAPETDRAALSAALMAVLGTDRVDVADLERATALLRFRAARDGVAVFEHSPGRFLRFQEEATIMWCDMEAVLQRAYGRVFDDLVRG